jgi:hypothetical protein
MSISNRLLLRGLRKYIPERSSVLALEVGASDALGPTRKTTAVLTSDALLLATPVRAKTVLTVILRADIRAVESVEPGIAGVVFDDYPSARRRIVRLDLSRHGDREGIVEQLRADRPTDEPA